MTNGLKTILLVEDEAILAMGQKSALERRGYAVRVAGDGEAAVSLASASPDIDLVLMDVDLGKGIDGPEAARRILASRDLPVVFLSSHTEPEVVEKTERITSYGYVVKNSGITVLDASIKMAFRLFDARRKEREKDEALADSLKTSADIVRCIPSGFFVYRFEPPNGLFLEDANPQAERMTGVLLESCRGREFNGIWPEAREGGLTERFLAVLRDGLPCELEDFPYSDDRLSGFYHIHAFALPRRRLAVAFEDVTERHRVEERLRISEAFHRKIIQTSLDGYWLTDASGRFLQVNEAYCRMSGYREEELLAMGISDVEAAETPEETAAHMALLMAKGEERFATRHRRKDGSLYDLEVSARRDPLGGDRVVAFLRDITARMRAEEELHLGEERLRLANKATNDVIWDWDVASDTQRWNESGRSVFGWAEAVEGPVTAGWWIERVHPEDRARVDRGFFAVVNDPRAEIWTDEYRFRKADGSYATVLDRGFVLRDGRGAAVRMIGAMLDVSARRRVEEELRKSAEIFRMVAENVREVLWLGSPDWSVIHYISPTYAAVWGREPAELYRRPMDWIESIVEEDREKVRATIPNGMEPSDGPILFPDYRIRKPDGEISWISARAFPVLDSEGKPFRIAGIAEDITERKRAEDEVRLRLREKEILLREVHHRIKNNFATVISLLNAQAEGLGDRAAKGHLLEAIGRIEGMRQVYEKLLYSDGFKDLPAKAYLEDLANSVMGLFGGKPGVTLAAKIEEIPLAVGAAFPLGIILNELLTNSMKYAFEDGRPGAVAVSLSRCGERITLTLSDDGKGLPPGFDAATSANLGLMLVRMLAEQLGGGFAIGAGESGGTKARVEFPG